MTNDKTPNGWTQWSKHVLLELERLNKCYEKLDKGIQDLRQDVVILKVKAGVWGLLGGMIPVAIGLFIWIIKSAGE